MCSMSQEGRQRILNVMGMFRPTFRQVAQSLTDIDLILVEEGFERLLLDYDRMFSAMAIPACLWRRTGEIYKGNKEFAALVNVPLDKLRNVRRTLMATKGKKKAHVYQIGSIVYLQYRQCQITILKTIGDFVTP